MEEKNIVAIDLGSSKIAITVANVNGNDVQVTYYKERPSTGIRYSSVYNIMHATEPLARIINEAEEERENHAWAFPCFMLGDPFTAQGSATLQGLEECSLPVARKGMKLVMSRHE